jgi:exodeoxyribonuclease V gamma subunit
MHQPALPEIAGFHLHHGNRAERLVDALAEQLRQGAVDALRCETVLVPHPGMAQWLKMRLADRLGIAANIGFPLPAAWFGRMAAPAAPSDLLAWSGDALAWRIFALQDEAFGPLPDGDGGSATGQRVRWQLCTQIAQLFERYQLQRPGWMLAWSGRAPADAREGEAEWQARLWRRLHDAAGEAQRQALARRLRAHAEPSRLPHRLFAFGFASLPRLFLDGLRALSQHVPVHLFFANPSRHYWGDLLGERERVALMRRLDNRVDPSDGSDAGHRLLASLGSVGRDFFRMLYEDDAAFAGEHEHFEPAVGDTVLAQVQRGILDLDEAPLAWRADDRSICLMRAPSRRRELEGLHDLLLDLLADPALALEPHDIAVMMPRLSDYAPFVRAVFDGQPPERRIPWRLTDLADDEQHPLPALFLRLLELPDWRFGLAELLEALARPAFAARFGIDAAELPRLRVLLEEAGARWGLDAGSRAAHRAGNDEAHTFRFALDRLLAGWALGEDVEFDGECAPLGQLRGADADLVGRFAVCLDRLDRWRQRLADPRPVSAWADDLASLRDDFLVETADADETAALTRLSHALEAWSQRAALAGDAAIAREVVRDALAESLHSNAVSALPGEGVNLCAMVPLRGLPFRVIALLGLGEGEFPRKDRDLPWDLCRRAPRPGDRSASADDRYLVLEALVSARDVLVLSHVDTDAETGQPRPASPVLAQVHDYLREFACGGDGDALAARVLRVAELPSDPRHFTAAGHVDHVPSRAREWRRPSPPSPAFAALEDRPPESWSEFRRLFTHPAELQLAWRGVRFDREEAAVDEEPFELGGLDGYRVRDALLQALEQPCEAQALQRRLGAAGLLPPGHAGRRAFAEAIDVARSVHGRWLAARVGRQPGTVEGTIEIAGVALEVAVTDADASGIVRAFPGALDGKRRMHAWLDLLALSLLQPNATLTAQLFGTGDDPDAACTLSLPDDPRAELEGFVALWQGARREPLPLWPRTSHEYACCWSKKGDHDAAIKAAYSTWQGGFNRRGESDDPACAELARCFDRWDAEPFAQTARAVFASMIGHAG